MLEHLSSPIRVLVIEVFATVHSQLTAIPWESIDELVSGKTPQFRDLTRVEVLVRCGIYQTSSPPSIFRDEVISEIMQRLPTLHLLGLLQCDTMGC